MSISDAEATLAADLTGEGEARRFVAKVLAPWQGTTRFADATLLASELVANVVRHAGGAAVLRILAIPTGIRIECADGSPVPPRPREGGATGGWGLALVEQLSQRWGVRQLATGKVVWCELAFPDEHAHG